MSNTNFDPKNNGAVTSANQTAKAHNPRSNKENNKDAPKEMSRKPLLGTLNTDLQSALNTWDVITTAEPPAKKANPGSEQLQEMKKLLGELKNKLAEFSE